MPADSVVSWGILLVATYYGLFHLLKAIVAADEKRSGGGNWNW